MSNLAAGYKEKETKIYLKHSEGSNNLSIK